MSFSPGNLVIRKSEGKHQQGVVQRPTENGDGLIVTDVLDLNEGTYLTDAGIIRPGPDDRLYRVDSSFQTSPRADRAREILTSWVLFQKSPRIQRDLLSFTETCFYPEQIIEWKNQESLNRFFVPIQQKFKIGKFTPKIDHEKELAERFSQMLSELYDGKHLTYVAFIPREANKVSRFYSIGTKPHLETKAKLRDEPGGFNPNQGGHIKVISKEDERPMRFLVDAGSYDLGSGMQTSLAIAEMVTDGLKKLYPEFEFIPVAGRGAHGASQSY